VLAHALFCCDLPTKEEYEAALKAAGFVNIKVSHVTGHIGMQLTGLLTQVNSLFYLPFHDAFVKHLFFFFYLGLRCRKLLLLCVQLLAVYTSDIEADVLDEIDGPLEFIC
jgi:hypothetical protein